MHFGNKNDRSDYFIDDSSTAQRLINLKVLECERDFGVFVSSDLKWNTCIKSKAVRF